MSNLITLAPQILGFLGGPMGGIAGSGIQWLADKFGASDKTKEGIEKALMNVDPLELRKIDIEFQKFCMDNAIKVDLAQIEVNKEEAKSSDLFVAGWRPFVGWICGFGLAYASILEPAARFTAKVMFDYVGFFPEIDTTITMQVLFGMLGMAGMRTWEKGKGVAK